MKGGFLLSELENKTEISKEEVWNVIEFAQALYNGFAGLNNTDYFLYNTYNKMNCWFKTIIIQKFLKV